jgi:hypothetical protein
MPEKVEHQPFNTGSLFISDFLGVSNQPDTHEIPNLYGLSSFVKKLNLEALEDDSHQF